MGLTVAKAYALLAGANKKASRILYKVMKSAFYNARQKDAAVKETDLYISKIAADSGPTLKRFRAMSMGRAGEIRRRTSHITIHLDRKELPKEAAEESKKTAKARPLFKKAPKGIKKAKERRKAAAGKK